MALILVGLFTLLALLSPRQGEISSWWIEQLRVLFGGGVLLFTLLLLLLGLWIVLRSIGKLPNLTWYRPVGVTLLFVVLVAVLHMGQEVRGQEVAAWEGRGGGILGFNLSTALLDAFGPGLTWIFLLLAATLAVALILGPIVLAIVAVSSVRLAQWQDDRDLERNRSANAPPPLVPMGPPLPSGKPSLWRTWTARLRDLWSPADDDGPTLVIGSNAARSDGASRAPRVIGAEPTTATPQQTAAGQPRGAAPGSADSLIPRIIGGSRIWRLPAISEVLDDAVEVEISRDEIRDRARIIEQTLADFGIPVRVVEANQGPAVTQYGLQPGYRSRRRSPDEMRREAEEILKQRGYGTARRPITDDVLKEVIEGEVDRYERVKIKVSKIQALTNDLALALSASPIRIEAPVPGRPLVGIEVPNINKALVSLRGVLESETFQQINSDLKIALGQDTAGQSAVADLARMPHLLVAGATGSGKSVCINAVIATLLLTHTPDTLRFLMVDPKMVELITYNGIPHLLAPVVVEVERVVPMLRWATDEMDRRYKMFSKAGARNLESYNEKLVKRGEPILPYIIVVIDELADLMMAAPDDVERYICRLAQMARATGIHLIIATQRPSVDVVTGLIKANFPARIAFAVTSQIDSRVILDTPGAEALLGRGDMLFMRPDSSKLERLQGCFVADTELERLVRYWKGVRVTEGEAGSSLTEFEDDEFAASGGAPLDTVQPPLWEDLIEQQRQADAGDDLYTAAEDVVRKAGRGSVSLLQRRLRIGYSRAARLIDLLEERGVLGPDLGGSRGREVLTASGGAGSTGADLSPDSADEHDSPASDGASKRSSRLWY